MQRRAEGTIELIHCSYEFNAGCSNNETCVDTVESDLTKNG